MGISADSLRAWYSNSNKSRFTLSTQTAMSESRAARPPGRSRQRAKKRKRLLTPTIQVGRSFQSLSLVVPLVLGCVCSGFATASDSEAEAQLQDRNLFAAFYYPWYVAEEWENDWDAEPARPYGTDGARQLRLYASDDPKIFNRHLELAEEFAIDVLVLSWMGQGSRTDINLQKVLAEAEGRKVKFAILYESWVNLGSSTDKVKRIDFSSESVRSQFFDDLAYLRTNYYERYPNQFTIDGKAMLYLYLVRNYRNLPLGFVDRIRATLAPRPVHIVADVAYFGPDRHPFTAHNVDDVGPRKLLFDAYTAYNMYSYSAVADGESALQYMMREAEPVFHDWAESVPFYPHVLPAYKDFRDGHGRLTGTKEEFRQSVCRVLKLRTWGRFSERFRRIVFITTFNEWYEGTSVEPGMTRRPGSRDYRFDYLDVIREVALKDSCG